MKLWANILGLGSAIPIQQKIIHSLRPSTETRYHYSLAGKGIYKGSHFFFFFEKDIKAHISCCHLAKAKRSIDFNWTLNV